MALPKMVLNSNIVHQVDILDIYLVTQFFDTIYFYIHDFTYILKFTLDLLDGISFKRIGIKRKQDVKE